MNPSNLQTCIMAAGVLHFCQLPAMLVFRRRVLNLGPELDLLAPVTRRIVQVLSLFVVVTVQGLGLVVTLGAKRLAQPDMLSMALLAFLAIFWSLRAGCQCWYSTVWPRGTQGRISHLLLLAIFVTQASLYLVALFAAHGALVFARG